MTEKMTIPLEKFSLLKEFSFYYNKMQDENNLMNTGMALFIEKCLDKTIDIVSKAVKDIDRKIIEDDLKNIIFKADDIVDNLVHYLEKYKSLDVTSDPQKKMLSRWFVLIVTSIYLYCFTEYISRQINKKEIWDMKYGTLFLARDNFEKVADETKIDKGQQEGIFSTIESRYGFNGPIKLKPIPDSPSDAFVYAIILYEDGIRFPREIKK